MVLQRTFEVSHLKDYLRSAEGIHRMFEQLGYDVYDPEPLDADDIDMSEADAQHVQAVYLINGMDFGHTIWLFEVDDTTTMRLRGLAYDVLQRPGTHSLVVTKDYREIIIAHPYFVGGTSKSHTRVNKLKIDSRNPTRHDVDTINALLARDRKPEEIYKSQDDAFNVNRVTNKFYREYRDYFHRVQDVVVEWNKGIAEFQNSDQRDKLHAFVQRLMGRLMFLYFLQRKGWLGGRSDFLTWQYRQMVNRHAGELSDKSSYYYREVLEPLFFDTLNKKRPDNWTQWGVEIPYLNGGLFDRSRDPDGIITLPDSLFDPNSNTGLLAFFNRYNFTITDDAPMEQDVAVDPEMLGKVFENMLEEEDRGQSGSFYTPRTIVSYMCQEALAGYLEEAAGIPREDTRRHFDPDDDITFTHEQAQQVSDALDTLTVLDPAVGSGSFLIGMLNEIITLRKKCYFALTPKSPLPQQVEERGLDSREQWHIPQQMRERMTEIARTLRKNATPSEDILWQALRNRQLEDRKFNRQVDIGAFVVDFYCAKERLVVEVDGAIHETQQEADRERQSLIESLGIRFVRVSADEVERNLHAVLDKIRSAFLPSPREAVGEGQGVRADLIAAWKEAIIRDTLYGVDIKPGAIEIAQLRLWLSLVVNQTMADAKPLPNLDYKLMAGNSLIETIDGQPILTTNAQNMLNSAAQPQQLNMFTTAAEENRKLEDLRDEYFHATPEARKQLSADIRFQERRIIEAGLNDMLETVQQRISQIEKKYQLEGIQWKNADAKKYAELLAKAERLNTIKRDLWDDEATLPFFLYRLHFNDVFARNDGFDVVVANPPYVRQELISDQKPDLQASYPDVYAGTADLFVYFFARALNLLRENGHLSFITPNKFMRANYGKKLRGFLANKTHLYTLIDFGDLPIFDATTYPMITIAGNQPPNNNKIKVLEITALDESETLHAAAERAYGLPQSTLSEDGWQLSAPEIRALMEKLKKAGKPLGDYVDGKFYRGIVTGNNNAFVIDYETRNSIIEADPKSEQVIKKWLRGRDVDKWQCHFADQYIIYSTWDFPIENYSGIKSHLEKYYDDLVNRPEVKEGRFAWYAMSRYGSEYAHEFENPKIVYQEIATFQNFAFVQDNAYMNNKCYFIPTNDLYLLGILNTKANWFFLGQIVTKLRGGAYAMQSPYVSQLPIPDAPDDLRGKIASLAQQCLDAAKGNPDTLPVLEATLNQLVYQAYGLDEDDIRVIEGHLSGVAVGSGDADDLDGDA